MKSNCKDCGAPVLKRGQTVMNLIHNPAGINHHLTCTAKKEAPQMSIWDDIAANEPNRDGSKRPLIIPPGGGDPVPYTRVSTFANYLDNGAGLTIWKARNVALGIARHDDLRRMVAGLAYGDKILDDHIETALTRMDDKAAWGTAIHSFTEPDGSPYVPDEMRADVASYADAVTRHGLTVEATEVFVVNDELRVAGTFDHVYGHRSRGNLVGDKKTGKAKAHAVAVQLACYAGGSIYNCVTGERTALDVRRDIGLLVHIPKERGRTEFFTVDIEAGLAAAHLAVAVRGWHERKDVMTPLVADTVAADLLGSLIEAATDPAVLGRLYKEHRADWTDAHTELARQRKAALSAAA